MNEHQSQFLKLLGGSASFSPVFTYLFLFFYFFLSSRGESPRWDPSVCMRVGQVPILLDLQYFPQFCGQMFGNVCFPKAAIHLSLSAANIHSVLTICTTKSEQARSNMYRSHLRAHQSLHKQHKPDFQLKMASVMYLTKNLYITNPVLLLVKWFLKLFFIKHFFFLFAHPPHPTVSISIGIHRIHRYPQIVQPLKTGVLTWDEGVWVSFCLSDVRPIFSGFPLPALAARLFSTFFLYPTAQGQSPSHASIIPFSSFRLTVSQQLHL